MKGLQSRHDIAREATQFTDALGLFLTLKQALIETKLRFDLGVIGKGTALSGKPYAERGFAFGEARIGKPAFRHQARRCVGNQLALSVRGAGVGHGLLRPEGGTRRYTCSGRNLTFPFSSWNCFMHIHILGICGTFMGGIAQLARAAGHRVTGCDANVYPPMSTQLQKPPAST